MNAHFPTSSKSFPMMPADLLKSFEVHYRGTFQDSKEIKVGNVVRLTYKVQEGEKERIQTYEGLIIAKQNRGLGESFLLRRNVQGVGVEQVFLLNSPKILSVIKKQESTVRRAKLFFTRRLSRKAARVKLANFA